MRTRPAARLATKSSRKGIPPRSPAWSRPQSVIYRTGSSRRAVTPDRCSYALSRARATFSVTSFLGSAGNGLQAGAAGLRTGQGGAAHGGGQALIRSRAAGQVGSGDGRRIVRRPARVRQPIIGSGRPRRVSI